MAFKLLPAFGRQQFKGRIIPYFHRAGLFRIFQVHGEYGLRAGQELIVTTTTTTASLNRVDNKSERRVNPFLSQLDITLGSIPGSKYDKFI